MFFEGKSVDKKYLELINLMQVPVIEQVIFAKLTEIKVLMKNEIALFEVFDAIKNGGLSKVANASGVDAKEAVYVFAQSDFDLLEKSFTLFFSKLSESFRNTIKKFLIELSLQRILAMKRTTELTVKEMAKMFGNSQEKSD